jgi:hypothetical protein
MAKPKGGLLGQDYWTVNVLYSLPRDERKRQLNLLRASGGSCSLYQQTQARNTKAHAEALAAQIKERFGFDMEINETCDLYL